MYKEIIEALDAHKYTPFWYAVMFIVGWCKLIDCLVLIVLLFELKRKRFILLSAHSNSF